MGGMSALIGHYDQIAGFMGHPKGTGLYLANVAVDLCVSMEKNRVR
jgi:hypothetical protein